MSIRCPACDETLPDEARFCWRCGHQIATPSAPEERRVVSVLFCDLAGFTERSDRADPEDVRRVLVPFHAAVQREIERVGGYLDKFIGDGALGVFGAPVAHEDDPLRAVEAGLAILREVETLARAQPGLTLRARAGVATGVAIVQLGAGPQVGEAIAGDVVNTASRLQSVAEPGTLVVDATVHPVIEARVDSTSLGTITVKGKREPLDVWRIDAVRPLASGPGTGGDEPPFVGRDAELRGLSDAWAEVVAGEASRMVAVVGEPGIGKSRLIAEVARGAGGRWLWGRCHPYGEGVTFAALAQLVREGLGLAADAPAAVVGRRVHDLTSAMEPESEEAAWLARHLMALLGLGDGSGGPPRPEEAAVAWGRALCGIAGDRPLALVVDDAHWAEPALIDVLGRLPALVSDASVLLVIAGRLEALAPWPLVDEPDRGDVVRLTALGAEPVTQVLMAIAPDGVADLSPDRLASVIDAASGNPLYAVEYGRLLADHHDVASDVPTSIRSLIAARLDALPADERPVLQDAAVTGRRFWASSLPAICGGETDPERLPGLLASLQRRDLIRPSDDASSGGDTYAFTHALVREVAYERLTRSQRIPRHRDVAAWLAGQRETLTDALDAEAHHRRVALELARATGSPDELDLAAEARATFLAAGNRSLQLDLPYAIGLLREALALTPNDDPSRADLIVNVTSAGRRAGILSPAEAAAAYTEAFETARREGDAQMAAEAMTRAAMDLAFDGAAERAQAILDEALSLLEGLPPTTTTVRAYLVRAEDLDFAGRFDDAELWLDRAAEILGDLPGSGLAPPRPADEAPAVGVAEFTNILLHLRGDVRCVRGDVAGGIEDIRRTLDLARMVGSAHSELTALSYLSEWVGLSEGPAAILPLQDRALRLSERRGFARANWWTRAERLWAVADLERWDEADRETLAILEAGTEVTGEATRSAAMWLRLRTLLVTGRLDEAGPLVEETVENARKVEQLQLLLPSLANAALVRAAQGDAGATAGYVREAIDATTDEGDLYRMMVAPDLVRACLRIGDDALASAVVDDMTSPIPRMAACLATAHAEIAERSGDRPAALAAWREALALWEPMGDTVEHRLAREAVERLRAREGTT